jgi:Holliday junction resolvase RusA-like endonuclease
VRKDNPNLRSAEESRPFSEHDSKGSRIVLLPLESCSLNGRDSSADLRFGLSFRTIESRTLQSVVRKLCVESDGVFFASIGLCGSLSSQSLLSLSGSRRKKLRQTRRKAFGRRDHFYSPSERQNHRLLGTRVERHQRLSSTDKPSIDLDIVRQVSLKRKRRQGAQFSALREIGSMRERALWARNLRRPVNVNFRLAIARSKQKTRLKLSSFTPFLHLCTFFFP